MVYRVYPRACGGTTPPAAAHNQRSGLSPRVRGNLGFGLPAWLGAGSIPARAGEPGESDAHGAGITVYPRACGGTEPNPRGRPWVGGLSPRVRGNPTASSVAMIATGSIPARAGEPLGVFTHPRVFTVYPRACGGTETVFGRLSPPFGLSPRVRGNPLLSIGAPVSWRSIPARAGEPLSSFRHSSPSRVYPRACGGTNLNRVRALGFHGLSPRVRGNPSKRSARPWCCRSIPARAGEPFPSCTSPLPCAVYPRACGGTQADSTGASSFTGLSPRVRGNRKRVCPPAHCLGSIPARAGEPPARWSMSRETKVYPRACGGTSSGFSTFPLLEGLSPRVRGNPAPRVVAGQVVGSIPARAGEPQ